MRAEESLIHFVSSTSLLTEKPMEFGVSVRNEKRLVHTDWLKAGSIVVNQIAAADKTQVRSSFQQ